MISEGFEETVSRLRINAPLWLRALGSLLRFFTED